MKPSSRPRKLLSASNILRISRDQSNESSELRVNTILGQFIETIKYIANPVVSKYARRENHVASTQTTSTQQQSNMAETFRSKSIEVSVCISTHNKAVDSHSSLHNTAAALLALLQIRFILCNP